MSVNDDMIKWAMQVLARECGREVTGAVRIEMHNGKIQRIRIEAVEKPGG